MSLVKHGEGAREMLVTGYDKVMRSVEEGPDLGNEHDHGTEVPRGTTRYADRCRLVGAQRVPLLQTVQVSWRTRPQFVCDYRDGQLPRRGVVLRVPVNHRELHASSFSVTSLKLADVVWAEEVFRRG
jgi:hypothetical protein